MAPQIKLIYFNSKGRAELSRLILAQAGVKYEDKRIDKEEWAKMKPTIPFGQLPALEYDGKVLTQSITIARFLAKENGLAGKNSWETAKADMLVDCIWDFINQGIKIRFEQDEAKKKEMKEKMQKETTPTFLKNIAKQLADNGGKYLVGDSLTWADICLASTMKGVTDMFGEEWKKHAPKLGEYCDTVMNLPNIKKWIETRPKTEM